MLLPAKVNLKPSIGPKISITSMSYAMGITAVSARQQTVCWLDKLVASLSYGTIAQHGRETASSQHNSPTTGFDYFNFLK
jgi:hypothetical protein